MTSEVTRRYDIVVFGATSFVGQILCAYLHGRQSEVDGLTWAIAGRNADKLSTVASELELDVDHIVADASDITAMADLAASTRVIISTVGPYSLYGSELVEAAANAGTDYCDLTGEPQWMQQMIDAHEKTATGTGARIVHACGFDSIPSDLGVLYTQRQANEILGEHCNQISMRVKALKGAASGGTIASMLSTVEQAKDDPEIRRVLSNPYCLAPQGMRSGVRQNNVTLPMRDEASKRWVAPFVMAAVNTRVVHRSHALMGRPWGEDFLYDEAMMTGSGPQGAVRAGATSVGMGGMMAALGVDPLRKLLADRVLPKPGEGPSPEDQAAGFYDLRFYGTTASGKHIVTKVTGDRDPGYGSTAKMLAETALSLLDVDPADTPGGFWTPATGLGDPLIDRLEAHAGLTFSLVA